MADALVLAAAGGQDLWVATRDTYLSSKGGVFAQVRAITHGDWGAYVAQSALGAWKETLGLLATYASVGELRALSGQLGARLEASDAAAATLCHMCAADVAKVVGHWRASYVAAEAAATGDVAAPLLDLMERCVVFQEVVETKDGYLLVAAELVALAQLLYAQGCLDAAIGYLVQLPADEPAGLLLREIYSGYGGTGADAQPYAAPQPQPQPQPQP